MLMHDPPHPGAFIRRRCLEPLGLTVTEAAKGLAVSRNTLSMLLNGRLGISPEMAIRLSQAFGGSRRAGFSSNCNMISGTRSTTARRSRSAGSSPPDRMRVGPSSGPAPSASWLRQSADIRRTALLSRIRNRKRNGARIDSAHKESEHRHDPKRYRMQPKERFLTPEEMARLNAVLARRRGLVPAHRRHRPPPDADRLPRRRDRLARMRLDSRQAHPPSRFEVRAAHDLAVEHRPRGHRRHPAL